MQLKLGKRRVTMTMKAKMTHRRENRARRVRRKKKYVDDEKSASEDDEGDESDADEAKESGKEEAGHVKVNKQLLQTLQKARKCRCAIQSGVASKCVVKPSNKIPATTICASIGS